MFTVTAEEILVCIGMLITITTLIYCYWLIKPHILIRLYIHKGVLYAFLLSIFTAGMWTLLFSQTFFKG